MIQKNHNLYKLYESCYRDNLRSFWAGQELYRPGNSRTDFFVSWRKICSPCTTQQGDKAMNYGTTTLCKKVSFHA